MYSKGKKALETEQKQEALKLLKLEEIMSLAAPVKSLVKDTNRAIQETTVNLTKLKAQTESLKAIGDITTQFMLVNSEIQQLRSNQKELIDLLKAVLIETYKDAQTQKRIEGLLI